MGINNAWAGLMYYGLTRMSTSSLLEKIVKKWSGLQGA